MPTLPDNLVKSLQKFVDERKGVITDVVGALTPAETEELIDWLADKTNQDAKQLSLHWFLSHAHNPKGDTPRQGWRTHAQYILQCCSADDRTCPLCQQPKDRECAAHRECLLGKNTSGWYSAFVHLCRDEEKHKCLWQGGMSALCQLKDGTFGPAKPKRNARETKLVELGPADVWIFGALMRIQDPTHSAQLTCKFVNLSFFIGASVPEAKVEHKLSVRDQAARGLLSSACLEMSNMEWRCYVCLWLEQQFGQPFVVHLSQQQVLALVQKHHPALAQQVREGFTGAMQLSDARRSAGLPPYVVVRTVPAEEKHLDLVKRRLLSDVKDLTPAERTRLQGELRKPRSAGNEMVGLLNEVQFRMQAPDDIKSSLLWGNLLIFPKPIPCASGDAHGGMGGVQPSEFVMALGRLPWVHLPESMQAQQGDPLLPGSFYHTAAACEAKRRGDDACQAQGILSRWTGIAEESKRDSAVDAAGSPFDDEHEDATSWEDLTPPQQRAIIKKCIEKFNGDRWSMVKVRKSTIKGLPAHAPYGVFANMFLPKGTVLGSYDGNILTADQYKARYPKDNSRYTIEGKKKKFIIDGADPRCSSFARFINHADSSRANCMFVCLWEKVVVLVTEGIGQEGELFVDYGPNYPWKPGEKVPDTSLERTCQSHTTSVESSTAKAAKHEDFLVFTDLDGTKQVGRVVQRESSQLHVFVHVYKLYGNMGRKLFPTYLDRKDNMIACSNRMGPLYLPIIMRVNLKDQKVYPKDRNEYFNLNKDQSAPAVPVAALPVKTLLRSDIVPRTAATRSIVALRHHVDADASFGEKCKKTIKKKIKFKNHNKQLILLLGRYI